MNLFLPWYHAFYKFGEFMTPTPSPTLRDSSTVFFIVTQYLGAFNDNIFKQLMLLLAVFATGNDQQSLASMMFSLPFILFSGYAGQFAERYPKTTVMRWSKVGELIIMVAGCVGFYLGNFSVLLVVLFVMGTQSAFFGPSKYGVIPELVQEKVLLAANGIIQMTTFAAVIFGTALAGYLMKFYQGSLHFACLFCVVVALVGIWTVFHIIPREANRPQIMIEKNPFGRVWMTLKEMVSDRMLFLVLLASSYFWFSGTMVIQVVNNYGRYLLHLGPEKISLLLVSMAIGIMLGCLSCDPIKRICGTKWTVILGAFGVAAAESMLVFYSMPLIAIHVLLVCSGFAAGVFYVPLATLLQSRPPTGKKGEVLAAMNFVNFVAMFGSGALWFVIMAAGVSSHHVWLFLAAGMLAMVGFLGPKLRLVDG